MSTETTETTETAGTTRIKPIYNPKKGQSKKGRPPNLDEIKQKIASCQVDIERTYLKIGRLLLEVKQIKPHGQWIPWINDNTALSISKAQRLMKVAHWMDGNAAPVPHLTFTQAYILCRLSPKELEEFGDYINGMENVKGMSKRELGAKVRDFLKLKNGKSSAVHVPKQTEVHASDKDNLLNRLCQIRSEVSEIASLFDGDSDEYDDFATDLCDLCQTIIQKLSPEDVESI